MNRLAVLGASGHGKVVADTAECCGWRSVEFFDDAWPNLQTNGAWDVTGDTPSLLAQLNQSGQGQAAGSAVASVVASALSSVGALGGVSGVSADGGAAVGAVSGVGEVSVGSVTAAVSPGA